VRARITISRAAAAVAGLVLAATLLAVPVVPPAQRFLATYQALEHSAEPLSAWERLTFSYLLARSENARAEARLRPAGR
jgi:hypothetical protein